MRARTSIPSLRAVTAACGIALSLWLGSANASLGDPSPKLSPEEEPLITSSPIGQRGGRLVTALRAEPKTFNPAVVVDNASQTIIFQMMADLIHINRETQEPEPALAKTWEVSKDGRRYTLGLRRGVRFSDGEPFDADDVLFTFDAYQDERLASPNRTLLLVGGQPITVTKIDTFTLVFELAEPYAAGELLFDSIPILPHHILSNPHKDHQLSTAWGLTVPPENIAGLGPFRLKKYAPGERCVLERNPYYWKTDRTGTRLPYLDELIFVFVPTDAAQALRFRSGGTDVIDRLSPQDFKALEGGQDQHRYRLYDLGPGLNYNFFFFNLNNLTEKHLPEIARKQGWFRQLNFRKAISYAIDREALVRLVYLGRAAPLASYVPPGVKRWANPTLPKPRRSLKLARECLRAAGFKWNNNQQLLDSKGTLVEFSIAVSSSNSQRLQMATIIQNDLQQLGLQVEIVPLEHRALVEQVAKGYDYEACILGFGSVDVDPNSQLSMLLSNGSFHLWHLGQQEPATPWEAEIDRLMQRQISTLEYASRKKLLDRVQEVMSDNLPLILLTCPHVLVGSKIELGNFMPAILSPSTIWNAEEMFWRRNEPE